MQNDAKALAKIFSDVAVGARLSNSEKALRAAYRYYMTHKKTLTHGVWFSRCGRGVMTRFEFTDSVTSLVSSGMVTWQRVGDSGTVLYELTPMGDEAGKNLHNRVFA